MGRITYQFRVFLAYAIIIFIVLAYTGFVSIHVYTWGATTLLSRLGIEQSKHYADLVAGMLEAGFRPEQVKSILTNTGMNSIVFLDDLPKDVQTISQKPDTAFLATSTEYRFYREVPELHAYLTLVYRPDLEALIKDAQKAFVREFFMILAITVTVGFYLTWFTLRQVRLLRQALQRIGQGDFTHRLRLRNHDEFGALADTINRTAEQLLQLQHKRTHLLNRVSHELKTPASIAVNLLYVASRLSNQAEVQEKIETARRHLLFQARLIDDILYTPDISKPISLEPTLIEADELIAEVIAPYNIYLDSLGIRWVLDAPETCRSKLVEADVRRMGQVFGNIIYNAARHLTEHPAPSLTISLTCDDRWLSISITDNGPGIPPHIIQHIFEPYVSEPGVRERYMGGRGLGLAIAKDIVKAHGGEINVESPVDQGRGARLIVQLPLFDEEALFA